MTEPAWHDDSLRVARIASPDGPFEAYLAHATARGRAAVVVLHEVFGVNADLRSTCDELAAAGFTAICPELFWRQERHVDLSVCAQPDWERGSANAPGRGGRVSRRAHRGIPRGGCGYRRPAADAPRRRGRVHAQGGAAKDHRGACVELEVRGVQVSRMPSRVLAARRDALRCGRSPAFARPNPGVLQS